jgi:hypothetical protein
MPVTDPSREAPAHAVRLGRLAGHHQSMSSAGDLLSSASTKLGGDVRQKLPYQSRTIRARQTSGFGYGSPQPGLTASSVPSPPERQILRCSKPS